MNRKKIIDDFICELFEDYGTTVIFKIEQLTEEEYNSSFDVRISNVHNDKIASCVLQVNQEDDKDGIIEVLKGEDFFETDQKDVLMHLFLSQLISYPEL
jgi:hypothetical protein